MKTKIYSILAFLFLTLSFTAVNAQSGTYCDMNLRFCVATSYTSWDMQTSSGGFYATAPTGISINATITPYGSNSYGFIWVMYGSGSYILEKPRNQSAGKNENKKFYSPGTQSVELFAEAFNANSFVSASWY